ncbi:MAG: hypothetical protein WCD75_09595 [Rhodoplanes sp.]
MDAERAAAALETNGQAITVDHLRRFAEIARRRMRTPQGYRRDHLRALAQRVEVADGEVRIMGQKTTLLRTLATIGGVETAAGGVRISVPNWRRGSPSVKKYSSIKINGVRSSGGVPTNGFTHEGAVDLGGR